jgi:hypothetical protein
MATRIPLTLLSRLTLDRLQNFLQNKLCSVLAS